MARTIIILEGCDGAGKTTLAENLKKIHEDRGAHVEIVHYGPPDESISVRETYLAPIRKVALRHPSENLVVICDRFAVGEIVYGEILRKNDRTVPEDFEYIFKTVHDNFDHVSLTYVRPDFSTISSRFNARGDDLITEAMLIDIHMRYDELLRNPAPELGTARWAWNIADEVVQRFIQERADAV